MMIEGADRPPAKIVYSPGCNTFYRPLKDILEYQTVEEQRFLEQLSGGLHLADPEHIEILTVRVVRVFVEKALLLISTRNIDVGPIKSPG
jgi:hypothetical protein